MCQALVEDKIITLSKGQLHLAGDIDKIKLPGSIQAIIRSQLAELSNKDKNVLSTAAVLGETFEENLLTTLLPNETDLQLIIRELKEVNIIHQMQVAPDVLYKFKDKLIHDVVYRGLLKQKRRLLHQLIAETIEEMYPNLEQHLEDLAYHFLNSTKSEAAIPYLEQAGDKAANLFSLNDARKYYTEALSQFDSSGLSIEDQHRFIKISIKLAKASVYMVEQSTITFVKRSLEYAKKQKDQTIEATVHYILGALYYTLGAIPQASSHVDLAAKLAIKYKLEDLLGQVYALSGRCIFLSVDPKTSNKLMFRGLPMLTKSKDHTQTCYILGLYGINLELLGDRKLAKQQFKKALNLANKHGDMTRSTGTKYYRRMFDFIYGTYDDDDYDEMYELGQTQLSMGNIVIYKFGGTITNYMPMYFDDKPQCFERLKKFAKQSEEHKDLGSYSAFCLMADAYALRGEDKKAMYWANLVLKDDNCPGWQYGYPNLLHAQALMLSRKKLVKTKEIDALFKAGKAWCEKKSLSPTLGIHYYRFSKIYAQLGETKKSKPKLVRKIS